MYKRIGVAVAFSPRCEAIIGEAARLQNLYDAELILIHIGEDKTDEKTYLSELVKNSDVNPNKLKFIWEKGSPAKKILSIGKRERLDLLVAGALQKESVVKFYFGSIARSKVVAANFPLWSMRTVNASFLVTLTSIHEPRSGITRQLGNLRSVVVSCSSTKSTPGLRCNWLTS